MSKTSAKASAASSDARHAILGRIKKSLAQSPDGARGAATQTDAQRLATVKARLAAHEVQSTLQRVAKSPAQLVALFRSFLEGQSASVIDVAKPADIAAAIAQYLRENNLPASLRMGDDGYLAAIDWSSEANLTGRYGAATDSDAVGLSHALAGVAETGTLFLASGADNPVTINFMPATHIIVIRQTDIVGSYEMAWDRIRKAYGDNTMPRTVNMISGPSRTGDIAGVLVRGAHGPKDICVIIVKDD